MESVLDEDSPLAKYLLEGEGQGSPSSTEDVVGSWEHSRSRPSSRASSISMTKSQIDFRHRIRNRIPQPLKVEIPKNGPIHKFQKACSSMVDTRLSPSENGRFLEHFRYTIVASQLLSEQSGYSDIISAPHFAPKLDIDDHHNIGTTTTGAFVTATTAFSLVWLIHWSRAGQPGEFNKGRVAVVFTALCLVGTVLYSYAKRKWLLYQRKRAIDAAQTFITNVQAFNSSSAAALTFVQDTELVSRGYRISSPLPPITRLEERGQARRCARLRKSLAGAYAACIPPFLEACDSLRIISPQDDFEKYLDVYEVSDQDLVEAHYGYSEDEFDDTSSLKTLRIMQLRLNVLRRELLCSLLSVEADGTQEDLYRWRHSADCMRSLASITGSYAERINNIMNEQELFVNAPTLKRISLTPSTSYNHGPLNPDRERIQAQAKKLGGLSTGIRGLQAKLQVLREESTNALDESEDIDVTELGGSLAQQYESIGADLKSLIQDWEAGKQNLLANIERNERRVSQLSNVSGVSSSSGGLRSPATSLGGLTAVDESPLLNSGSPSDALRALNGDAPMKRLSMMYNQHLNTNVGNSNPTSATSSPLIGMPNRMPTSFPSHRYTLSVDTPPLTTGTTFSGASAISPAAYPFPNPITPIITGDEEIFEAIAIPRSRLSKRLSSSSSIAMNLQNMSREEKIRAMQEEQASRAAAAAAVKERREAGFNLIKELDGVLANKKLGKREGTNRVTSFCL